MLSRAFAARPPVRVGRALVAPRSRPAPSPAALPGVGMDAAQAGSQGVGARDASGSAAAPVDAAPPAAAGTCRVAVAQMTSTGDRDANFATVARLARDAAEQGCRMLFLPENTNYLGLSPAEVRREVRWAAQPQTGAVCAAV